MQKTTFLHTADLHLGRAYKNIGGETATVLAEARFQVLEKIQELVEKTSAA